MAAGRIVGYSSTLLIAATFAICPAREATAGFVTYDKTKTFTLHTGGDIVGAATALYTEHAWVLDPTLRSDVKPKQGAGFDPGGKDRVVTSVNGIPQPVNSGTNGPISFTPITTPINAGGGMVTSTAQVNPPINAAQGTTTITVNPFAGGNVSGSIHVNGSATANPGPNPSQAYAFSFGSVSAFGNLLNADGTVFLSLPFVSADLGSSTDKPGISHILDPVTFTVTDLVTGLVTSGTLFQLNASLTGDGALSLSSQGLFSIAAANATFSLDLDSPFIPASERGHVNLIITNGIVTTSDATGIFAGFLPSVGSSGTFSGLLPGTNQGAITFDYHLGDFVGDPVSVGINFSDAGDAFTSAVPEPGSLALASVGAFLLGTIRMRRRVAGVTSVSPDTGLSQ